MTIIERGKVYLVGAGPGDPELLTVKAHALLQNATIILHDDLVAPEILALAGSHAIVLNVGKRCGAKRITQPEINHLMIASARRGMSVARLKSGDPAIFGRLAEELDALKVAGVPFEIVPGITAGAGAAASLGVSLTDRRKSSRLVIVSGHHAHGQQSPEKMDWTGIAREDTTLVVYMPGQDYRHLQQELLNAGLAADTPSVIVSRATTPQQKEHHTTLGELSALPRLEAPSILLIGRSLARDLSATNGENPSAASEGYGWESFLDLLEFPNTITATEDEKLERRVKS